MAYAALLLAALHPCAAQDEFQLRYFDLTEGRIAFSYTLDKLKDIYVLDFKDLSTKPLVTSDGVDEAPSWSPDGQKIVFHSDRSGDMEIYSINADGSDLKRLTKSRGADEHPSFSPNGEKIIFQSARNGQGSEIFFMDADGSNQKALVSNPAERPQLRNVTPRFSPRGDEFSYVTDAQWPGWDIALRSIDSQESKVLTQGLGSYIRPAWTPTGGAFAFSYGSANQFDIYMITKGSEAPTRLFHRDGRSLDPCWNEDGALLFFVAEQIPGTGDFQLMVWDRNQTRATQILSTKGQIRHPSWTSLPSVAQLATEIKKKDDAVESSGDKPRGDEPAH